MFVHFYHLIKSSCSLSVYKSFVKFLFPIVCFVCKFTPSNLSSVWREHIFMILIFVAATHCQLTFYKNVYTTVCKEQQQQQQQQKMLWIFILMSLFSFLFFFRCRKYITGQSTDKKKYVCEMKFMHDNGIKNLFFIKIKANIYMMRGNV